MSGSTGTLIITFDLELGWGSILNERWKQRENERIFRRTRVYLRRLLPLLDQLDVPVTWATVGGLLEEKGTHQLDHLSDRLRERISTALENGRTGTFYGRDLLERIRGRPTDHGVACHSYSHVPYDHPDVSAETVRDDLDVFRSRIEGLAPSCDAFVFPRNNRAHQEIVREMGYRIVRSPGRYLQNTDNRFSYAMKIMKNGPSLSDRWNENGLTIQSSSMRLNPGPGQLYKFPFVFLSAFRGLRKAVHTRGTFLIWDHPFSFAETPGLFSLYRSFLRRAATYRDRNMLSIRRFTEDRNDPEEAAP